MPERKEVTSYLSELVRKRLKHRSAFYAEEVELDLGKYRVDFIGFSPYLIGQLGECSAAIDKGTFSFYEVKSSIADFNSGNGKNWFGDENYLVCERELADELHVKGLLPGRTKILVPNKSRTSLLVAYDLSSSFGSWSIRTKSSGELLWDMIRARNSKLGGKNEDLYDKN